MGTFSADEDSSRWLVWSVRSSLESCTSLHDEFVTARPCWTSSSSSGFLPTNGESWDIQYENGNGVSLETLVS